MLRKGDFKMANLNLKFLQGVVANLPSTAEAGAVYFTKDENIYLGLADGTFKRYGDFTIVTNVDALPTAGANERALYYCVEENVLAKYDKTTSKWIQINVDTDTTYEFSEGTENGKIKIVGKNKKGVQVSSVEVAVKGLGTAAFTDLDTINTAIADAKKAGTDAQADVDALEEKVGTLPEGETDVIGYINKKTSGIATDTALQELQNKVTEVDGKADTNAAAITKLNANAETEGSVDYKIAQAVAKIMENPDEAMNSIQELVTWTQTHATEALALTNQVEINKTDIANLNTLVGDDPVATQIANAIAEALKTEGADKYALATDLAAAVERILTLEGKAHTHENKTVLDGITTEKVAAWDAAEQNAKDYADGLDSAIKERVQAIENDYLKAADKTELEGKIGTKANSTDVYTKEETYTKSEVYAKAETYTQSEVNDLITNAMIWGEF